MGESVPIRLWKRLLCVGLAVAVPVSFGVAHAINSHHSASAPKATDVISVTAFGGTLPAASDPGRSPAGLLLLPRAEVLKASLLRAAHKALPFSKNDTPLPAVITQTRRQRIAAVSANTSYDVPKAALDAYRNAAKSLAATSPSCHLRWGVLAAIGQVESDQGRYGGAKVLADGTTYPTILGMELDGTGNVASIPDTDNGVLDGDTVWDRAVGPMQFIPSTWAVIGADGDGNGTRDPNDFDDAALATARYLCAGGDNMRSLKQARNAIFGYNHSNSYVTLVLTIAQRFDSGVVHVVPNSTPPTAAQRRADALRAAQARRDARAARHQPASSPPNHKPRHGSSGHHPKPTPKPHPKPKPTPKPTQHKPPHKPKPKPHKPPHKPKPKPHKPPPPPTPEPVVSTLDGTFTLSVDGVWSIGTDVLDFGTADLTLPQADYDGDGVVEPVTDELDGLSDIDGTVGLGADGQVLAINDLPFDPTLILPPRFPTKPTDPVPVPNPPSTGSSGGQTPPIVPSIPR